LPSFHRTTETAGRGPVLCNQNKPARFAVKPVDDGHLPTVDQFEGEQFAQSFPKRRSAIGLAGVNKKQGRLLYDEVIVGFG
jgi:hypothetical protein